MAPTGAASALQAAARLPDVVKAIVSRAGRPDMAGDLLTEDKAPTLLVVGSLDTTTIIHNEEAYVKLFCKRELRIVQDASHLFEEDGKLGEVAALAIKWFDDHLILNARVTKTR